MNSSRDIYKVFTEDFEAYVCSDSQFKARRIAMEQNPERDLSSCGVEIVPQGEKIMIRLSGCYPPELEGLAPLDAVIYVELDTSILIERCVPDAPIISIERAPEP